jgi:hypothetical protein
VFKSALEERTSADFFSKLFRLISSKAGSNKNGVFTEAKNRFWLCRRMGS